MDFFIQYFDGALGISKNKLCFRLVIPHYVIHVHEFMNYISFSSFPCKHNRRENLGCHHAHISSWNKEVNESGYEEHYKLYLDAIISFPFLFQLMLTLISLESLKEVWKERTISYEGTTITCFNYSQIVLVVISKKESPKGFHF